MPRSSDRAEIVTTYAHNPTQLMRKSTRKRTASRSGAARKATPRKRTSTRRATTRGRRRNPVAISRGRRGSVTSRATSAFVQAGTIAAGSIAAGAVGGQIKKQVSGATGTVAALAAPAALGVLLLGSRSTAVQNAGLGMVVFSATGAAAAVMNAVTAPAQKSLRGSYSAAAGAPAIRQIQAPAQIAGGSSSCGCKPSSAIAASF